MEGSEVHQTERVILARGADFKSHGSWLILLFQKRGPKKGEMCKGTLVESRAIIQRLVLWPLSLRTIPTLAAQVGRPRSMLVPSSEQAFMLPV